MVWLDIAKFYNIMEKKSSYLPANVKLQWQNSKMYKQHLENRSFEVKLKQSLSSLFVIKNGLKNGYYQIYLTTGKKPLVF